MLPACQPEISASMLILRGPAGDPCGTPGVSLRRRHSGKQSDGGLYFSPKWSTGGGLQRARHARGGRVGGVDLRGGQKRLPAGSALLRVHGQWHRVPGGMSISYPSMLLECMGSSKALQKWLSNDASTDSMVPFRSTLKPWASCYLRSDAPAIKVCLLNSQVCMFMPGDR